MIMYNSTNHILSIIFLRVFGSYFHSKWIMDCVNKIVNRVQKKNLVRKKANRACRNLFLEWKSVKSETKAQQNIALPIL